MGFKCAPQIKGLVRGTARGKHRANGKAICAEAGSERISKSETIDRTRSPLNQYGGITDSGFKLWDKLEEEAESYEAPVTMKSGKKVTRKLRSDAVIGYAVIINPPDEMCEGWDAGKYAKFYADSMSVLSKIEPRLFRSENMRMWAKHRDEGLCHEDGTYGEHMHGIGVPKDKEGRYCGNLIDTKLKGKINERYPAMMRAKGWDLDDLDITDWERYNSDADYKAERDAKRSEHGLSVNDYVMKKNQKYLKALDAKQAEQDHREKELDARDASLNAQEAQIATKRKRVDEDAEEMTDRLDEANCLLDEAERLWNESREAPPLIFEWLEKTGNADKYDKWVKDRAHQNDEKQRERDDVRRRLAAQESYTDRAAREAVNLQNNWNQKDLDQGLSLG